MPEENAENTPQHENRSGRSSNGQEGIGVFTMFLTAVMSSIIVLGGIYGFRDKIADIVLSSGESNAPPRVVYVDTKRIFSMQVAHAMGNGSDPAEAVENNRDFTNRFDELLARYTETGYFVLVNEAVLKGVPGRDVTETLLQHLGLSKIDDAIPVPTNDK